MARPLVVAAAMLVGLLLPLAQVAAKLERSVCYYENWAQVGCFGAPGRAQALQALPSDAAATAGVPRLKRFFKRSPAPSGQHRQALPPELSAGRSPLERRSASTAPPAPPLPPPALITAPPACLPRLLQYRSGSVGGTTCTYLPKNINASLCTHINYAFAFLTDGKPSSACAAPLGHPARDVPSGGSLTHALYRAVLNLASPGPRCPADYAPKPVEWNDETELYPQTMALKKQNPDLKVMISLGGWYVAGRRGSCLMPMLAVARLAAAAARCPVAWDSLGPQAAPAATQLVLPCASSLFPPLPAGP